MKKFYNLGARSFMLILTFEAPKLQVIEIADNIDPIKDLEIVDSGELAYNVIIDNLFYIYTVCLLVYEFSI